jgi:hypothetical protein
MESVPWSQKLMKLTQLKIIRATCVLQVLFEIITKALTIRDEPMINKLLLTYQTIFIKGRYIIDGVMLLQEILREKKRKQQGVVLKIDFENAYDKVNCDFLFCYCKHKGLSDN